MAIVKNLNEILNLIPEPDYRLYGSNITEAPSREVIDNPLFAFTVYRKNKVVIGMFRAMFMLVKRSGVFYLMVVDYDRSNSTFTDYIKLPEEKNKKLSKTDWPFVVDEIGLRIDSSCYDRNMIYFATRASDINDIKEALKKGKKSEVLTLEPVIV